MKLILLILLFITATFAQDLEKVSLQLKWKYQFQFAGFIMAKEKGFYKDAGLDVDLLEFYPSTNMMQDIKTGTVDFGVSDSSLILEAMSGEPVVAMLSILQNSPYSLMALKSAGIKSLEDINGKKLALYENLNGMSINAMLESHHIEYVKTPIVFSMDTLLSGENDMKTVYLSNEPFTTKQKGIEFVLFTPKDYGFDGYGDMLFTSKKMLQNRPEIVEKMYKSSKKGWEYAFSNIEETVGVIHKKYNTLNKSKKALTYEAKILKSLSGYGKNFGHLDKNKVKNIAQLFSFIKKGKRNFENLNGFIYEPKRQTSINLTKEEKEFIKNHPTIVLGTDENWAPYVIVDKNGKLSGYDYDVLNLINQISGTNFKLKVGKWSDITKAAKAREIDGLSTSTANEERNSYLNFSNPYSSIQNMILSSKTNPKKIETVEDLKGKTIAIHKGNLSHEKVVLQFKNSEIVRFENSEEVTNSVITGKVDAMVGNGASQYFAQKKVFHI